MLDWLKKDPREPYVIEVAGQHLPVTIRRLSRARRITLRLSPDGKGIRISMPDWGRTVDAIDFAHSRRDWLASQVAALPRGEPVAAGGTLHFRGNPHAIEHSAHYDRKPVQYKSAIRLGGPEHSLAARLKRWLEREARMLFSADVSYYCERAGRPVAELALSRALRRWGSCSPSGSIRINWRLIMAPDDVRRSVVAHEVAHLVHFDHSAEFHAILNELFEGDMAEANAWLKREGRSLYIPFG